MHIDFETFQSLPTTQVAQLVRAQGSKVCVFPINGTRRWFILEHPPDDHQDYLADYLEIIVRRHIELYQLLFDHGLDTLLTPAFGPDLMERDQDYIQIAAEGLSRLVSHPDFVSFYADYGVRVRFYGDYRKHLGATPLAHLADLFDESPSHTAGHDHHRLFFGLFAHDAAETIAELGVQYHSEHGKLPDKRALVEMYYGEQVRPVDLFIGFDKFCAFDMPLVATGNEDLYFTVCPSPFLNQRQLRGILYDHLYTRRQPEPDYEAMQAQDWAAMRAFYQANLEKTLGIGAMQRHGGFWYPLPQVELPPDFRKSVY